MPGIVSLLPSATEWVYALGLEQFLVGVTFECDHPPQARAGRAVVVGGLATAGLAPGEIDALVRRTLAAGAALYTVDQAAMAVLAPQIVLTQDLCRVCALPADAAREAAARVGDPAAVVTIDPHTLPQVLDAVQAIGAACADQLGDPHARTIADRAAAVRTELQQRLDVVRQAVTGRPRPRVLVLEWVDPPFVAGHWVPDLVDAAGAEPLLARPGERSVTTDWSQVRAVVGQQPVAVLVAPCGFGLEAAIDQARGVVRLLPTGTEVWAVDAAAVITRPGPRVVDGVEALAAAWHPEVADPSWARTELVAKVAG